MKTYNEKDLPNGQEIFNNLKRLRGADSKVVEELRDWVFDKVEILKSVISTFVVTTDFSQDPEDLSERLLKYHNLNAGMIGLVEGLYEKALYLPYRELTEESRSDAVVKKQKLTAGDRELYAKGEAADLKGLRKDLEETQRNLWERLQLARYSRR